MATSVERLSPENITIVDTGGNILNDFTSTNGLNGSAVSQRLELTALYEQRLSANLRAMLERVYGFGKVVCLVSVELDFDTVEQYQEIFSAPTRDGGLIRSQQSFVEYYANDSAAGVPGVTSNIPGYVELDPEEFGAFRQESTINYELNRTEIHQMTPPGAIKQLSVSIWIDGELTQAELDTVRASVVGALGINLERGDTVAISAIPFQTDFAFAPSEELLPTAFPQMWVYLLAAGLLIAAAVALVLWRRTRRRTALDELVEIAVSTEEETVEDKAKLDVIQRLKRYTAERPKDFAQMIRSWLLEE